ncbi:hypothetical protein TNCV_1310701 [Trichonephila clavipes]|nr:hypothetical protein TNCV_1310701 [Trichonephila clavipes]
MLEISTDPHLDAPLLHSLWQKRLEQGKVASLRDVGVSRAVSAYVNQQVMVAPIYKNFAYTTRIFSRGAVEFRMVSTWGMFVGAPNSLGH